MRKFDSITDIYYGTSDTKFNRFSVALQTYKIKNIERFVGIIGGMAAFNFIALLQPKAIVLCDINPFSLIYAKLLVKVILQSKNSKDFFKILENKNYDTESEEEKYIQSILYYMGISDPLLDHNWTYNIPGAAVAVNQSRVKTAIQLRHPKISWAYALDNFALLKSILSEAVIEYKVSNILDEDFNDLLNIKNTWTWLSNIDTIGFKSGWFSKINFIVTEPNCVITTEISPHIVRSKTIPICLTKKCLDPVTGHGIWEKTAL